jgi:hypothetical protein
VLNLQGDGNPAYVPISNWLLILQQPIMAFGYRSTGSRMLGAMIMRLIQGQPGGT